MSYRYPCLVFKILLLLVIVSCVNSYGQDLNDCLASIGNNKITAVKWPHIDNKQKLNDGYWITSKQFLYQPRKDILWVDIRSKADKKTVPLAGVISLSVVELESTDFLFEKNLVLIGTGFDQLQIDIAINQLRKVGFKRIFALAGGVRAWSSLNQQKISLVDEISAEQFLLGSKIISWKVIAIGLTDKEIATLPEKPFKQLSLSNNSFKEIAQFIKDEQLTNDQFISLVLVTSDIKTLQQLKQQLQPYLLSEQVVWLQGGFHNYQNYIEQQHKVIASKGSNLSRPCGIAF